MLVVIKDWFLFKMKEDLRQYGYVLMNYTVVGETEKAYKLEVEAARCDGEKDIVKIMWCPKSCVMSKEEIKTAQNRFEEGCKRYDRVLNFAKENGLKVRNKMKLKTILSIIKTAGLVCEI